MTWHNLGISTTLLKHSNPAGPVCSPCGDKLKEIGCLAWNNRAEGPEAENACTCCVHRRGQPRHPWLWERPGGTARPARCDHGTASFWLSHLFSTAPTILFYCTLERPTAPRVPYTVSHLCAFAHVVSLSGTPYPPVLISELTHPQDYVQLPSFLGGLPQALRMGPTLPLAQHLGIDLSSSHCIDFMCS